MNRVFAASESSGQFLPSNRFVAGMNIVSVRLCSPHPPLKWRAANVERKVDVHSRICDQGNDAIDETIIVDGLQHGIREIGRQLLGEHKQSCERHPPQHAGQLHAVAGSRPVIDQCLLVQRNSQVPQCRILIMGICGLTGIPAPRI
jgi:hypothetical protein